MKGDQIGEGAWRFVGTSPPDGEPAINRTLHVSRSFRGVMASKKGIGHILPLAPHLDAPASGLELRKGRHCVCTHFRFCARYACTARSNAVQFWLVRSAHTGVYVP